MLHCPYLLSSGPPEVARGKEVVSKRRVKVLLAELAMLLLSVVNAAPAMANHDWDGWWDNCNWVIVGWHWIPA